MYTEIRDWKNAHQRDNSGYFWDVSKTASVESLCLICSVYIFEWYKI